MKAVLTRLESTALQTLGRLTVYDGLSKVFECVTIERAWKNNEKGASCIPLGRYSCIPRVSPKHGKHYHITNVPNRDLILFHAANYATQLEGCVALGSGFADINKDGVIDIINSNATMAGFIQATKDKPFDLQVWQ